MLNDICQAPSETRCRITGYDNFGEHPDCSYGVPFYKFSIADHTKQILGLSSDCNLNHDFSDENDDDDGEYDYKSIFQN